MEYVAWALYCYIVIQLINDGSTGNADINGAANIIRKVFSNIKEWDIGIVDIPYAVTVA